MCLSFGRIFKSSSKTMKITYTAIMLALLIVVHINKITRTVTSNQPDTDCLRRSGRFAFRMYRRGCLAVSGVLVGIGPAFVQIIPFIALGNLVLVLVVFYLFKNKRKNKMAVRQCGRGNCFSTVCRHSKDCVKSIPNLKEKQIEMSRFLQLAAQQSRANPASSRFNSARRAKALSK